MCVYEDCIYLCPSKKAHHFRYARMRKNKDSANIRKSSKVNWEVVAQMKLNNKILYNKKDEE
jgi:hypothetical protein